MAGNRGYPDADGGRGRGRIRRKIRAEAPSIAERSNKILIVFPVTGSIIPIRV
jgi:hypothetical protein